ncbi:hypothetical protein PSTT_12501 [Puccinia striiformis]|uniref:fructose-2,6-bisphosphate 2-phosphatase n=1 Tax=Puccinia striiformis TaxID=27350 RepID=A0A2S4UVR7_9BASI|nr:hypothetical protein PSTT_12501 [Puccinia striiformis]
MSSGGMGRSQSEEEGSAAGEQGRLPTRSYSHQQRDPTPKGLSRTSSSSTSTHRRTNRSLSSSNRKSPIIFPHARSSTHSSPKTNHSSLSRNSSLHSSFSEAAYRSSNCNSPTTSPQPLPNHPTTTTPTTANTPTTSFHSAQQQQSGHKKSSRHPSFSYHGLEGKGSTGSHVQKPDYSEAKIVVAMVGLPARGKSYLSNKLQRYLKWLEFSVRVFNVGQHRRDKFRKMAQELGLKEDQSANFFDPNNEHARHVREELAAECLESLISWLKAGGNVGIHDATNTTKARRKAIVDRVKKEKGISLIFLESICTDPQVIEANVDVKVASGDPDYDGQPRENAKKDFLARIAITKLIMKLSMNLISAFVKSLMLGMSYLASRVAFYLMNLHITPRSIFFTRHGESQYNVEGKLEVILNYRYMGMEYAKALPKLIGDAIGDRPLTVWTSTLKRTIQTARDLPYPKLTWKSLDELDAGVCDGMTYEEIEEHYPEDYAERDDDKFNYRYRGGESYRDVVVRLEPVIMELERQENILIAVLRCLYAYFHNYNQDELPYLKIPLHTVIKLTPKAYGCDEERFTLPIEAVDTTRPKPVKVGNTPPAPKIDDSPSPSTQRP